MSCPSVSLVIGTSLHFSFSNPNSLHFQHAQTWSHASISYLKSAKWRWIVMNNILSIMAGREECGERDNILGTCGAIRKPGTRKSTCLLVHRLVNLMSLWTKLWGEVGLQKTLLRFLLLSELTWTSGPTFVPALLAHWRDKLRLVGFHHWKWSKDWNLYIMSNILCHERQINTLLTIVNFID